MRERLINEIKTRSNCNSKKLDQITYGINNLYLFIKNVTVLLLVSFILNLEKELIFFLIAYVPLRSFSGGLHAKKGIHCTIFTPAVLLLLSHLSINLKEAWNIYLAVSLWCTFLIFKNSPADTKKRPIVNSTYRKKLRLGATLISILYCILIIKISNYQIKNILFLSLILQSSVSAPLTYKIFKLPYDNYLKEVQS